MKKYLFSTFVFVITLIPIQANPTYKCSASNDFYCRPGYYCSRQNSSGSFDDDNYGRCLPNIVLKQSCFFYKFITSALVRVILIFYIVKTGIDFVIAQSESVNWKTIVTIFVSSVIILSGPQLVGLIIGRNNDPCYFL